VTAVSDLHRRPPPPLPGLRLPQRRQRDWGSAVVAFLFHAGLVALALWPARALLEQGAGRGPGPRGGGGGGGRDVDFVTLPAAPPQAAEPAVKAPDATAVAIPPPVITPDLPPVEDLARIAVPAQPSVVAAGRGDGPAGGPGSGPGSGGGRGTGVGTGTGADRGPGTGGDGSYILQATPRGVILPPQCAKGRYVTRFWVAVDGRVTDVAIVPLPNDGACRRDFEVRLRGYRFDPAKTRDGTAVASVFEIQIGQ
jgi:hypothetical protein